MWKNSLILNRHECNFLHFQKSKMMKKSKVKSILLLFCFLLAFKNHFFAQTIITCDSISSSIFGYPCMSISEVTISNCAVEYLDPQVLAVKYPYDITIQQDSSIFGFAAFPIPSWPTNYYEKNISSLSTNPMLPIDTLIRGLTCDETYHSFGAGKGIVKYGTDMYFLTQEYLGDLPPDLQCLGDITYRRGKFYLSAIGNKLVEVNMKDPSKSHVVMYFPPGTLPIHGLATVQVGCDSVITYAIGREYTYSKIYEIDFNNWTIAEVCQIDRVVTGAGAKTECMLPPCDLFIDLDNDNSSFAFWGNYCADSFCLPPVAVADTDVVVLSMANSLDSMLLELTGIQNGASEYLETNLPAGAFTVLGNGSSSLRFINNGAASLADFELALKSVVYQNTAVPLAYGMRHVRVTGWSGGVASIVSTADLPLSNEVLHTTALATMPSCYGLSDGSLAVQVIGGNMPYAYQWGQGNTDSLLVGLAAGSYQITVSDAAGCIKTDTFMLPEPEPLEASIANLGLEAICDNSGNLAAVATGGTLPYSFQWDNGAAGPTNANIGPGVYVLSVVDSNGCSEEATYTILSGDTVLVQSAASICQGESFSFYGSDYSTDTLVCYSITLANGCDSTICLSLTVHPMPVVQVSASGKFCQGQAVLLDAGQHLVYAWSTGESSPSIAVQNPGEYLVTVSNAFGCTAAAAYTVAPAISLEYETSQPTCYGFEDGGISISTPVGGTAPYSYSIDGINFSSSNSFTGLGGGDYWPTILDAEGCKIGEAVALVNPPPILLNLGADQTTSPGVPVHLTATVNQPNLHIQWEPADFLDCTTCLEVVASPPYSLTYMVTASDANGCESISHISVIIDSSIIDYPYYIPNSFSPNGDGFNDNFTVFGDASMLVIASLEIFDRWGEKLFDGKNLPANDLAKGWDGSFKEKPMPNGVYVFVAKLRTVDGRTKNVKGEVNLLR